MSTWFFSQDLDGIANYFRIQSKEELMHADKMFDYLNSVGSTVILGEIAKPPYVYNSAVEILKKSIRTRYKRKPKAFLIF